MQLLSSVDALDDDNSFGVGGGRTWWQLLVREIDRAVARIDILADDCEMVKARFGNTVHACVSSPRPSPVACAQ